MLPKLERRVVVLLTNTPTHAHVCIRAGIAYSDDKLLQTRVFSYADAQRYRLGSNYLQLPANAPRCATHNNHHEGFMNFMHRDEEVNYFPSRYGSGVGCLELMIVCFAVGRHKRARACMCVPAHMATHHVVSHVVSWCCLPVCLSRFDPVRHAAPTPIVPAPLSGKRERAVIAKENNFAQPGERFRSWDAARQERFISRMADILGDKRCTQVRAEHLACSRWPKMLLPCMVVCHVPGFLL